MRQTIFSKTKTTGNHLVKEIGIVWSRNGVHLAGSVKGEG
jgi:hypothetical protein